MADWSKLQNVWQDPWFQAGVGMLSANRGPSGGDALQNALRGGMQGMLRGQTTVQDIQRQKAEAALAQQQQQQRAMQLEQQRRLAAAAPQLAPALVSQDPQVQRQAISGIAGIYPEALPGMLGSVMKSQLAPREQPGIFQGTGMQAQDSNLVMRLAPKIQADKATPEEQTAYSMAYQRLQRPTTTVTPEGTYIQPGMQLPTVPPPAGLSGRRAGLGVPGFTPKPPTQGERKALGQFERMSSAQHGLMQFEQAPEFDAGNLKDWMGARLARSESAGGAIVGTMITSPEYQQYSSFAGDWIAGLLRYESGAAVPESEFHRYFSIYFPLPGEDPQTTALKAQRRAAATSMVEASAGRAKDDKDWRNRVDTFSAQIEPNPPRIPGIPAKHGATQAERVEEVDY